jgi:hypothetical protein
MNVKHLMPVLLGLMLSGGLFAATVTTKPTTGTQNSSVQHLTCIQDTQGLMCNVDASSNTQSMAQASVDRSASSAPILITSEQLAQGSDFLLGLMYFGLPSALVVAVLLYDNRAAQHERLVSQLERIWDNSHY